MIQFRRIAALYLGLWMGAATVCDLAVSRNFSTIDTFIASPGTHSFSVMVNEIGPARARQLLRANASEENAAIFEFWERVQIFVGAGLFLLLLFGDRPSKLTLALALVMLLAVCLQRFYYGPLITELGRAISGTSAADPLRVGFQRAHAIYGGIEVLKLITGFALAVRTCIRSKGKKDQFAKEYELMEGGGPPRKRTSRG